VWGVVGAPYIAIRICVLAWALRFISLLLFRLTCRYISCCFVCLYVYRTHRRQAEGFMMWFYICRIIFGIYGREFKLFLSTKIFCPCV